MDNWFIFYVNTGEEYKACTLLNQLFDKSKSIAFVPQVKLVYKNSKSVRKELRPMFPGYVFTESVLDKSAFARYAYRFINSFRCIFYLLKDGSANCMTVSEDEKRFLLSFCNDDFIVEDSRGIIVGDKVTITSGPLAGKESIIKKIDRHKRRAVIELMWLGQIRKVNVSLEIVSKMQ